MRFGSTLAVVALQFAALWVNAGCGGGDDDHAKKGDAGTAGSGGSSSAGSGGSSATMDAGIKPLGDDIAGKPCSSASDCNGAMCATQIAGGAILPVSAPDGYCTGACATNTDCGSGGVCAGAISGITNGDCFAGCSSDDDCRDGYLCIDGVTIAGITIPNTCRPKPATDQLEDGVAGKACSAAADCSGGTCLTMRGGFMGMGGTTLPEGYCTGSCLKDSECGAGGVCSPGLLEGTAGSCYEKCSSDTDCTRDGYRCRQVGMDLRGCDPFPDPLPDGQAGKACTSDTDCGGVSGTCKTSLPAGGGFGGFGRMDSASGGYCSQTCEEDADCGLGGVCIGAGLLAGSCFKPCDGPTDCRDGYSCQQREANGFPMLMQAPDAGMSTGVTVCAPLAMMTEDGGM